MTSCPTATERFEKLIESAPWRNRRVALALGAVLAVIDYFSGPEIIVPIYFILPVMLMAWNWGVRYAVGLAVLLSVTHICFLNLWGVPPTGSFAMINAVLRAGVLMMLAVITARLGAQTRAARVRVQMLEGILPTCCVCKDIRNDDGQWERIETYVSRHSAAKFSHGICPPCAEKHYGMESTAQSGKTASVE
jgi:K+-sensing histidine kinase KdpD